MKLDFPYEHEKQEFKRSLAELDKGILSLSAMLNKHGKGNVYFGVQDNGEIIGLKNQVSNETLKNVANRVTELIKPSMLLSVIPETIDNKTIIHIEGQGNKKPYSCGGDYRIRIGSENKKIDPDLLGDLFFSSQNNSLESIESINQNLSFNKLKLMYSAKGLTIQNENFEENMNLRVNGKYNMLAELLADQNDYSIKVVRFAGTDKTNMVSRKEYGFTCLLTAMIQAKEYVLALNETRVDIKSDLVRKDTSLFDSNSFEEAWTNACLHNKWVRNVPPAIYIFNDRIEIVSTGGLPFGYTKEEFYRGISNPINKGLFKIMGQLGIAEQTGHGNLLIISKYGRGVFDIEDNHIIVTIPFSFIPDIAMHSEFDKLTDSQISSLCDLGTTRISQVIEELKNIGQISRVGSNKTGYWLVK